MFFILRLVFYFLNIKIYIKFFLILKPLMYIIDTNLYYVVITLEKISQLIYNFQLWTMHIQNKPYLIYNKKDISYLILRHIYKKCIY